MDAQTKRHRGTGSVRKRNDRGYFIRYYKNGVELQESVARILRKPAAQVTEQDAQRALQRRLGEVAGGRFIGPQMERRTINDLIAAYVTDLRLRKGAVAAANTKRNAERLPEDLRAMRAVELKGPMVSEWMAEALEEWAPSTVNHTVTALKSSLRLALRREEIVRIPYLKLLTLKNARRGFFERHEFLAIVEHLPAWVRDIAWFAYLTGCRKGEIFKLRWEHVDRAHRTALMVDTKNGESREIPLDGRDERGQWFNSDLWRTIERRWQARKTGARLAEHVFHDEGLPVLTIWPQWFRACQAAGFVKTVKDEEGGARLVPTKLFHDFRRTAVRDMVRARVPETVAMSISGHKTRQIFDRYNIVSGDDQREAVSRTQTYRAAVASNVVGLSR